MKKEQVLFGGDFDGTGFYLLKQRNSFAIFLIGYHKIRIMLTDILLIKFLPFHLMMLIC